MAIQMTAFELVTIMKNQQENNHFVCLVLVVTIIHMRLLSANHVGCLVQVVTIIHTLLSSPVVGFKSCMVLAPINAVLNWVNEWGKWLKNTNEIKVILSVNAVLIIAMKANAVLVIAMSVNAVLMIAMSSSYG